MCGVVMVRWGKGGGVVWRGAMRCGVVMVWCGVVTVWYGVMMMVWC